MTARSRAETAATEAGTEAAAEARLARLLDASPAVIYSFEAKGDFSPTYAATTSPGFSAMPRKNISTTRIFGGAMYIPTTLRASRRK